MVFLCFSRQVLGYNHNTIRSWRIGSTDGINKSVHLKIGYLSRDSSAYLLCPSHSVKRLLWESRSGPRINLFPEEQNTTATVWIHIAFNEPSFYFMNYCAATRPLVSPYYSRIITRHSTCRLFETGEHYITNVIFYIYLLGSRDSSVGIATG
jgi:hypothetical protein